MKSCYVGTSRAFTILFNWTVTLVSRALSETPSFVSYLSISSTSKILFHWIVAFASRTLEGFSSIQLERWFFGYFHYFKHRAKIKMSSISRESLIIRRKLPVMIFVIKAIESFQDTLRDPSVISIVILSMDRNSA